MNKVPVMATIEAAYGFAFGRFLTVLGVVWLPYLLLYGFIFGVPAALGTDFLDLMFSPFGGNPNPFAPWYMLGVRFLPWIAAAIIQVGVLERALGIKTGPALAYLSLGKPVWRMLGAWILAAIFFIIAIIVIAVIGGILIAIAALAASSNKLVMGLAIAVLVAAIVVTVFYFALRLFFLLGAVVVAEQRIGIERTVELSKGNVGRLFVIALAIFIPVLIAEMILAAIFLASAFPALSHLAHTLPAIQAGEGQNPFPQVMAHMSIMMHALLRETGPYFYVLVAVGFLFRVLVIGLLAGAAAHAYRALVPPGAPEARTGPTPPAEPPPMQAAPA